ncbi:MAG: hypothetical protein NT051_03665 [Candidatus Micrarchaeota archaeon]|nr:hypothetical protein [Candidatus Micrarchaeota archaeon]
MVTITHLWRCMHCDAEMETLSKKDAPKISEGGGCKCEFRMTSFEDGNSISDVGGEPIVCGFTMKIAGKTRWIEGHLWSYSGVKIYSVR